MDQQKDSRRGFKIAALGLMIAFAGLGLGFLDPSTGDGGSGGILFKLGFAGAIVGILIGIFGSVVHFTREK